MSITKCHIGTDIVQIARINHLMDKFGDRFLKRIYTLSERKYCLKHTKPSIFLAGHFAAKEAASKALGTGFSNGVGYKSIEILHRKSGKPLLKLHDGALKISKEMAVVDIDISISHEKDNAVACVVFLAKKNTSG